MDTTYEKVRSPRVVSSALGRIASRVLSSAMFGITLLLLARVSSVSEFGQFMVAGSTAIIAGIFVGFGAPSRVLRCAAEDDAMSMVRALYLLHAGAICGLAVLMLTGAAVLGLPATVAAGIIWGTGDALQNYAQNHLAGIAHHRTSSVLVATQRLAPCATVLTFLIRGESANYWIIATAFAVTFVVGAAAPLRSVRGVRADFRHATGGVSRWWALSMSAVLVQLQSPVLAAMASTAVVGLYAMAAKVVGPMTLLPASLSTVVIPELARRLHSGESWGLYRKVATITVAYSMLVIALAWPTGLVVIAIAGHDYAAALPVVIGMVIGAALSANSQAAASMLIAADHPNRATACVVSGQVLALLLLAVLGAWGSIASLAAVPIVAEIVVLSGMLWAVWRIRTPSTPGRHAKKQHTV